MTDQLPEYERSSLRMVERAELAAGFATQIELTVTPFLDRPFPDCRVIDIGCGYGHGVAALARRCVAVVGVEPNAALASAARGTIAGLDNAEIRQQSAGDIEDAGSYDIAILDNVLEHIEDQPAALAQISRCLRPGGVAFVLVPNRLWPIEVHYGLPFLSYLPLPAATAYLRASGRGSDYRDASYAPTLGRLRRLFADRPELTAHLTLPGDVSLAEGGSSPLYRYGVRALRRFPALWMISKSFLVVAKKKAA
ncbi:MAG TPA: class I SAM-dependent methyltransferase [Pseudonocardia sp.]|nr:class I SAM-dependent methyltransferase [Pseudonocardia sp.]